MPRMRQPVKVCDSAPVQHGAEYLRCFERYLDNALVIKVLRRAHRILVGNE